MVENRLSAYEFWKRIFDVVAATTIIVILSPLLVSIAALVRVFSGAPVLYRGRRIGRYGREFVMYKFRTMQVDAERLGTTTALGDRRVTPVGVILRHYKLDELPQLLNVLSGEMSLVGPRPEVSEHIEAYTDEERTILSVRPGITDYSSVHFASLTELLGAENAHEVFLTKYRATKNELRLLYVRERSFSTDIKIIGFTCRALIAKLFSTRR